MENPTSKDILERLSEKYRTPARWAKAVQRLKEQGKIQDQPQDIGLILKEVWPDIESECKEEIMEFLWNWASSHIRRGVTRGMPEWYKEQLMKKQFEE